MVVAANLHEQAVVAEKEAFITELKALIETLEGQVQDYRRTKFGPESEKLDPAQLELALEDPETAISETQVQIAAVEGRIAVSEPDPSMRKPRAPRKAWALPEGLPRALRLCEPDSLVCPCGCGTMVRIGEVEEDQETFRGTVSPTTDRAIGLHLPPPLVDEFFTLLAAQAARVPRKSDPGEAMAYMLKRQDSFRVSGAYAAPQGPRSPSTLRRRAHRHRLQPCRKRHPQPGHEPPQCAFCGS